MKLDPAICYRAVLSRDRRFDGRFFTCVRTTGIYCRPICPARPPKLANCQFVPTAAAAQELGYRPCLRCRPESSPSMNAWQGTLATVSRAWKLIEAGALDEADVASLAAHLGVGDRQLRRLFRQHIGASPITVAQTRRMLLAKQLIHQTNLSMIDVALASGFGSVRRFNETFQKLYQRSPGELRRAAPKPAPSPELSILLPYQPPYDWDALLGFFRARAIEGVEVVTHDAYRRVVEFGDVIGDVEITHAPEQHSLRATIRISSLEYVPQIITRLRRQFDLGADPQAIAQVLSRDELLAPLVQARPGLRVPGGWDGFEIAVRAILGQQITVAGATRLVSRLVAALGPTVDVELAVSGLTHGFPRPECFRREALHGLGMTAARALALVEIAQAVQANPRWFEAQMDLDGAVASLRHFRGIGEWSAQYIAMRALGESDAFLAGDAALHRSLLELGQPLSPADLLARAQRWRPWRAYALLHLWNSQAKTSHRTSIQELEHATAT